MSDNNSTILGQGLLDWMFQDVVGVYKNSSKWTCVVRYFVNPAFALLSNFAFCNGCCAIGDAEN